MKIDREQLKKYAENKEPVKKYLDLAEGENVININYTPKSFFTRRLMIKIKWRIFKLNVYKFLGIHKNKIK